MRLVGEGGAEAACDWLREVREASPDHPRVAHGTGDGHQELA